MTSAATRFSLFSFITCLSLAVLIWGFSAPPASAEEYKTVNELLRDGELDQSYAEDGVLPDPPAPLPPEPPANPAPDSSPAEKTAPSVSVAEPVNPFAEKVIKIGRPPYIGIKGMMRAVHGLIGFLRQEMGVRDVRLVTPKDYAGVLSALEGGAIDFAWMGPTAFAIGAEKIPLVPLARAKRRTGGNYYGVIVARKDSGITRIEEIRGKVIGFVDPESASGYLYPLRMLLDSGINPHKDCRKVEFLRQHDAVLAAVWAKKVDVGAVIEDSIAALKDPKILDQIVVLGKTAEIPTDIVVCRADCDPILRDRFQQALLKTGTLKQITLASSWLPPIMEFLPVNQADIDNVKKFLKTLDGIRQP